MTFLQKNSYTSIKSCLLYIFGYILPSEQNISSSFNFGGNGMYMYFTNSGCMSMLLVFPILILENWIS